MSPAVLVVVIVFTPTVVGVHVNVFASAALDHVSDVGENVQPAPAGVIVPVISPFGTTVKFPDG